MGAGGLSGSDRYVARDSKLAVSRSDSSGRRRFSQPHSRNQFETVLFIMRQRSPEAFLRSGLLVKRGLSYFRKVCVLMN